MDTRIAQPKGRPPLLVSVVATALGAGFLPVAPGTWGTAVAVPLAYWLDRYGDLAFAAATAVVIVVGVLAADAYCRATGRHDNQQIVIDEVAGYLVTLLLVPRTPANLLTAFFVFRVLDIWKPPPVRWIDRNVTGGVGVMADDVGAGVYGAALLWILHRYAVLTHLGI